MRMNLLCVTALALLMTARTEAAPVLLISVDGMIPDYYLDADKLALKVPNLRLLMAEGAYAQGAISVMPTVTFPAHTTMITGVNPNRHGIMTNEVFDPDGLLGGGWHWYYDDIKVPNLFGQAHAAGLKTATVTWPVTAGAPIDLNLPDMYPIPNLREAKNMLSLARSPRTEKILTELLPAPEALVHMKDDLRAKVAVRFWEDRPDFMAVHFLELDEAHHRFGPRAPEALAVMEYIDDCIGQLFEALRTTGRWDQTTVVLVSDHGFMATENEVRIGVLLRTLGLVKLDARGKVTSWRAMAWPTGGTAAIFLHAEATLDDRRRVDDAVKLLLSNPAYGVAHAYKPAEMAAAGGLAGAYVVLEARPPFWFGKAVDVPDLIGPKKTGGNHGFHPMRPELRAAFLMRGPGVRAHKNLGVVRLLDVAPTIARVLKVELPKVDGRPLPVQ